MFENSLPVVAAIQSITSCRSVRYEKFVPLQYRLWLNEVMPVMVLDSAVP